METETNISIEERRKQLIAEIERLRKQGIGDSHENEQKLKKILDLEKELFEIDPPPK